MEGKGWGIEAEGEHRTLDSVLVLVYRITPERRESLMP